jgi:K(+)-stimulated pyrophosphate-energized sodium pump
MENNLILIPIVISILGLLFMFAKMAWVKKQSPGNERMQEISKNIKEGALAFLSAEYKRLAIFVVIASAALFWYFGIC